MGIKDKFTAEEWRTLQFAPFWVYNGVAHADQEEDHQKRTILAKELTKAAVPMKGVSDVYISDLLVRDVLVSLFLNLNKLHAEYANVSQDTISGLNKVAGILNEKATSHQARKFKDAMLHLGQKIAEGSSKDSPDTGGEISEKSSAALSIVASALQVDDYERGSHIDQIVEDHLISGAKPKDEKTGRALFTSKEWNTLLFGPLWIVDMVTGAKGKVDGKTHKLMNDEINAFSNKMAVKTISFVMKLKKKVDQKEEGIPKSEAEFGRQMMAGGFSLLESLFPPAGLLGTKETPRDQQILNRFINDPRSAENGLADVKGILDIKASPSQASEFKQFLLQIGEKVSSSAGGGFLGLGGKSRKKKKAALAQVSEVLQAIKVDRPRAAAKPIAKKDKKIPKRPAKKKKTSVKKQKPGDVTVGDAIKVAIEKHDMEILSVLVTAIEKKTGHGPSEIFELAHQVSGIDRAEWDRLMKKINR